MQFAKDEVGVCTKRVFLVKVSYVYSDNVCGIRLYSTAPTPAHHQPCVCEPQARAAARPGQRGTSSAVPHAGRASPFRGSRAPATEKQNKKCEIYSIYRESIR